jgi:c-di-GMP-binding flagellar brake protein YcgR
MEIDKILKILATVEVEVISEKEYEGTYLCKIEDIEAKKELHITLPMEKGRIVPLRVGTAVRINITEKDGVYSFAENIIRRVTSPYAHFIINYPKKIERLQRRNYVRMALNVPVEMVTEDEVVHKGVSIDVSGGGMLIAFAKKEFALNTNVTLSFKLTNGNDYCGIKGIIKRERDFESVEGVVNSKKGYGIDFTEINQKKREEIISYLFELQRDRRKNNIDY